MKQEQYNKLYDTLFEAQCSLELAMQQLQKHNPSRSTLTDLDKRTDNKQDVFGRYYDNLDDDESYNLKNLIFVGDDARSLCNVKVADRPDAYILKHIYAFYLQHLVPLNYAVVDSDFVTSGGNFYHYAIRVDDFRGHDRIFVFHTSTETISEYVGHADSLEEFFDEEAEGNFWAESDDGSHEHEVCEYNFSDFLWTDNPKPLPDKDEIYGDLSWIQISGDKVDKDGYGDVSFAEYTAVSMDVTWEDFLDIMNCDDQGLFYFAFDNDVDILEDSWYKDGIFYRKDVNVFYSEISLTRSAK